MPMRPSRRVLVLAALAMLAALFAPMARASSRGTPRAAAPATCDPLPGEAPDTPPVLRSAVGLNYSNDLLASPADAVVRVCVLVDSTGVVREASVLGPRAPFDDAALDAARWSVFEPARRRGRAVPARVTLEVSARTPRDADPLVPDVLALARQAEAQGDLRGALDAWTGTLARVGVHPALQDEWTLRAHALSVAARFPAPPTVPAPTEARARGTHNLMLRNISRADNADYARALDDVLREAPWYADAYRWRAAARAASGQRDGAVRDVLCYRLAADSAGRALAERALVALSRADTLAALTLLRH